MPQPQTANRTNNSRTVRWNGLHLMMAGFSNASRANKIFLITSLFLFFSQLAVSVTAIILGAHKYCDYPLIIYLILYSIRTTIIIPYSIHHYLYPIPPTTTTTIAWFWKRLKTFLDIFGFLLFIIGNIWLLKSETCYSTSSFVYYTSLTWVIFGYIYLLIPLFLCAAIIFCLPCVLFAMRFLQIGQEVGAGASEEAIQKISKVQIRYKIKQGTANTGKDSNVIVKPLKEERTGQLFAPEGNDCVRIIEEEDCNCVICLSDYEEMEYLRLLPCSHHFHQSCVDEWLRLHKTCPLCVSDPTVTANSLDASFSSEDSRERNLESQV